MDSQNLLRYLRLASDSKEVADLLKDLKLVPPAKDSDETTLYLQKKEMGFALELSEGSFVEEVYQCPAHKARFLISSVFFASKAYGDGYETFNGALPSGLYWGVKLEQVVSMLGAPDEEDAIPRQLTVYWRKRNGLDIVCGFNKKNNALEQMIVGLANRLVRDD